MSKLTELQNKVEVFIEINRIHLNSYAIFNKDKFKNKEEMDDEISHARTILASSAVKHLMKEDKIREYLKEIPPDKNCEGTTLEFDVFVFSEDQLRRFVEMIENNKNLIPNIVSIPGMLN